MLSLRLLVNNRILVIKFWRGTKVTGRFLTIHEAGTPKPQVETQLYFPNFLC